MTVPERLSGDLGFELVKHGPDPIEVFVIADPDDDTPVDWDPDEPPEPV